MLLGVSAVRDHRGGARWGHDEVAHPVSDKNVAVLSGAQYACRMCRNIRTLSNFEPPATDEELTAAATQFVRKVAGTTKPSAANRAAFDRAIESVTSATARLLGDLVTSAPPRDREVEAAKAKARSVERFSRAG